MNTSSKAPITFCFPKTAAIPDTTAFFDTLIEPITDDEHVAYAGFLHKQWLRDYLAPWFALDAWEHAKPLSSPQREQIRRTVWETIHHSTQILPPAVLPRIYVFPFIPQSHNTDDELMGYVYGFTPHENTVHIFLSPAEYDMSSLRATVAHEYNHAFFFALHPEKHLFNPDNDTSIVDILIWEGLAEHFSEEITQDTSQIVPTLSKEEARGSLQDMATDVEKKLRDVGDTLYEEIFFGHGRYKKWAGYVIGYYLVESYFRQFPSISWRALMKKEPYDIYKNASITKDD